MSEKIDTRKWICVSAEKLYATSSGDVVFLIMTNEEMATPIYEKFKTLAGNVNEVYEKTGIKELRIEDNPFVDLYRRDMIEEVAKHVIGKSYTPFQLDGFADGFIYELNDVVSVVDKNGEKFEAVIQINRE